MSTSNWQPVETAPKDGTIIDLWASAPFAGRHPACFWGKPYHSCGEAGQYCDSDWHWSEPDWVDGTVGEFLHVKPSHWMPVPEPPCATPIHA